MPNYFFTDSDGNKWGPLTEKRLQTLIDRGTVVPTTPLTTDTGHTGLAGQIPGLNFDNVVPHPFAQPMQTPRARQSYTPQGGGSIISWLLDFAFRDLRLPVINLWACRILYVLCYIATILWGFVATVVGFVSLVGESPAALLIVIPLIWLGVAIILFLARLSCEWYIIVFDWIVETTKAARKYNNE